MIDLSDVVAILKAHRVVEVAGPQTQLPSRPLDNVAVADHRGRAPFEDPRDDRADGDEPADGRVDCDKRDGPDQAADEGRVVADDRVAGIDGYAFTCAAQPAWSIQPRVGRDN